MFTWKKKKPRPNIPRPARRYFELQQTNIPIQKMTNYGVHIKERFQEMFPNRSCRYMVDPMPSPLPIGVAIMEPTAEEPMYILHTIGISDVALLVQTDRDFSEKRKFTEICMLLPGDWPFPKEGWDWNQPYAWPVWLAMELGHFFHSHLGWVVYGTTLSNSESQDSFSIQNRFSSVVLAQFQGSLGVITMPDGEEVDIFIPIFLYPEEVELMETQGPEWVADRVLMANHNSFILNENRISIVKEGK